ncbi:diaminopimelate epimerase [Scatolibacter rhodanostii]|uniref:diaminopimelate epimerase n=1 Tax=Scatolibacter rhodanostii TaxID=2014781 RepID=UPI000C07B610|nr:diaminopimelate epimerase [Scatolibacter rhodanostii]
MKIPFTKMQGCGNDYIYINGFEVEIKSPEQLSIPLSDRHFGIGGDGLVLILPSAVADAKMRMFNIDGSEGKMCGNAIRCVAKYLYEHGIVVKNQMTIETLSGIKTLDLTVTSGIVISVQVDMGKPILEPKLIPTRLEGEIIVNQLLDADGVAYPVTCVSMGNPHAVIFTSGIESLNLPEIGPKFENHPVFPEQVNTEFIEVIDKNMLKMRVWERGSGETLACGTGACASVVAAVLNGYCNKNEDITVQLLGGELLIRYTGDTVFMTGGCEVAFEGTVEI